MPLFRYSLTRADQTKIVELRKSNPQGWLFHAVETAYPEIASRRSSDLWRLRLIKIPGVKQTWQAEFHDNPHDLLIQVTQT